MFKSTKNKKAINKAQPAVIDEIVNTQNDEQLVAVITAAIMATYGAETNCNLRVTSFRRINDLAPVWNKTARLEYLS